MTQIKTSKFKTNSNNKLFVAVATCIVLVVAGFIGSYIMLRESYTKLNIDYQRHFNLIKFRIREINLRLQNDPKNKEAIDALNDTVENDEQPYSRDSIYYDIDYKKK